jgi:hypothetical protein
MMTEDNNEGKLEIVIRILGNELVGIKMIVDDFKMKWLIIGVAAVTAIAWAASIFGPALVGTFGG